MCVIIDACARDRVFVAKPTSDALPVRRWITERRGRMAYGGTKHLRELLGSDRARREIRAWVQAGLTLQVPNAAVDAKEQELIEKNLCKSNDQHIVALAIISGARVLYSFDSKSGLHEDFKNKSLVDNPGGSVYQHEDHAHLLSHHSSCRQ